MKSMVRFVLMLVALSLLFAPVHVLAMLMWSRMPTSLAGWGALLVLPVPLAVLGERLIQYRDIPVLRPIDNLAVRIVSSPYRLAMSVTIVLIVGVTAFGLLFLIASR